MIGCTLFFRLLDFRQSHHSGDLTPMGAESEKPAGASGGKQIVDAQVLSRHLAETGDGWPSKRRIRWLLPQFLIPFSTGEVALPVFAVVPDGIFNHDAGKDPSIPR
jgi:hypothetical protein